MTISRALVLSSLSSLLAVAACSGSSESSILSTTDGGGVEGGSADGGSDATQDTTSPSLDCPTPEQCMSGETVSCSTNGAQCNVPGYVGVNCVGDTNGRLFWLCAQGGR